MLGHFAVRFKVFGRRFDSRNRYGRKNFFFFIFYGFVVLETFGEILVLGSIPGVCMDIFLIFFSIWWCGGMSMVKKDAVAKPLRGG